MSNINPNIFKAYDIRGLYPEEIDEQAVYAIARATAQFMFRDRDSKHRMAVAMDNRDSSLALKEAVMRGLAEEGVEIIDCGVTTTPMFYFSVNHLKADGGIMITASHNPSQYNGLKIVSAGAQPIGENSGLRDIKDIAFHLDSHIGLALVPRLSLCEFNPLDLYVEFLTKDIKKFSGKVVVDASCGTAGAIVSEITKKIGFALVSLCFAPCSEISHGGDPLKDENIKDLAKAVGAHNADFGAAFDTDGDRVFFLDKTGERVPPHAIACLLAEYFLKKYPGVAVIADVRMPMILAETVEKLGGKIIISRVGHAFIKKIIHEEDVVFGAEISGHFYFRDFFGLDSGSFAFMCVLNILAETGKSLDELARPFLVRFQSGELNYKVSDTSKALATFKIEFADAEKFSEIDGLSIFYRDWWCNIRTSNTEPLLRVNVEADTNSRLEEIKEKVELIISKFKNQNVK